MYYDFLAGELGKEPEVLYEERGYKKQAAAAEKEARQFTLGEENRRIHSAIKDALGQRPGPWVLIGGPPCQAYSLVGRARNKAIEGYTAEKDHRNFLYLEYLKVIARFQPAVFVMENVKGILSAKVNGQPIFERIRRDLECPARTLHSNDKRQEYSIFSLSDAISSNENRFDTELAPKDFIIQAEDHGVPQARHRVILLGIRNDYLKNYDRSVLARVPCPSVEDVIGDLPELRSGLSKVEDSHELWVSAIQDGIDRVIKDAKRHGLDRVAKYIESSVRTIARNPLGRGSNWAGHYTTKPSIHLGRKLQSWYKDPKGWRGVCNHETRAHIPSDLHRYLFCACYSATAKQWERQSPKVEDFPESLAPDHANWKSGHFIDRFRVQIQNGVATTITSHISKDGHYYIHYDPLQCRSLTVREAARIQTFPDNYFFVGNRTQQYVQVGNAVPPFLANQIADIVHRIICAG